MTFDPFGDFDSRGYLRNVSPEKDPAIIKRQEHHTFRMHVGEALEALSKRPPLTYDDVLDTHRRLFSDYYPWAGQDRLTLLPSEAVGRAGRFDLFAHPQDIRRASEYVLTKGSSREDMQRHPGEVMGLLAHAHPFLDGNGRTLMTVHAELARRAGIHIAWQAIEKNAYLEALTGELERPGKVLDDFLAPHVRRGTVTQEAAAKALRDHAGLGPDIGPRSGRTRTALEIAIGALAERRSKDERAPTPITHREAGKPPPHAIEEPPRPDEKTPVPRRGRDPSP